MKLTTLHEYFVGLMHNRHFQRSALVDTTVRTAAHEAVSGELTASLIKAAVSSPDVIIMHLAGHPQGLTEEQASAVRRRTGLNEIDREKPLHWGIRLWSSFKNPFNLLLTLLAVISFLTQDNKSALVILCMVAISTVLRFWQESKSNKAAESLKEMVSNTATVQRPTLVEEDVPAVDDNVNALKTKSILHADIPIKMLVPGDVILLSAGDMIPADCRVLFAKDLYLGQSAMSGESMPVEKHAIQPDLHANNVLDLENILFMGTNVVSGSATAVVLTTGNATYFGTLASQISVTTRTSTAFQAGVNKVSWLLIRFMVVMVPLVFLINGFSKGDWLQALLFSLSVAVGLTPEMLPMIVTSTLAKGAVVLSRKKVIVKRLDAIQSFGAMDVLCTDKTGTLTQDKIFLARHVDVWGKESSEVLELAYLNSFYQTGLKNLLDVAVLEHQEVNQNLTLTQDYIKIDEIPFDFTRRRMSVVVCEKNENNLLITKGAVEEILAVCTQVKHGEITEPLSATLLERIREITGNFNDDGLRVVAVATRAEPQALKGYSIADESELTLVGYIAFLDPPKDSAAPALMALAEHGVLVKVLTGDNERVTAKICKEVGLQSQNILLGQDIENMQDNDLLKAVEIHNVFSRLTPLHKDRIVKALKKNMHIVGYMGDGINDAPALHSADVGISVDTAVDIAREAADIILLEKNLLILVEGVLEGRRTFSNMLKYIKMTSSSNFGNVFSVLFASALIPFLPMLPVHLLVQNLLYDISQSAIPFDNVDDELTAKPQHWQPSEVGRFMIFFGPISTVFDLITFSLMWYVFGANSPATQTLFQSGWFIVGLLTQTLIVHMIRTPKVPFIQSRASLPLIIMTALVMAAGIFLPMGPLASYFKLESLPPLYFSLLPVILAGYIGLTQLMKMFYIRRYGW